MRVKLRTDIDPVKYFLNVGALLHRISWFQTETFNTIMSLYYTYECSGYPNAIIVFAMDGYDSKHSTKDMAHLRLNKMMGREAHFT